MSDTTDDTRQRLITAAGEIFADVGFRAATVRDICRHAGANLASVNYYFGDKLGLYVEAVQSAHCGGTELLKPEWPAGISAPDKLRFFIREWLRHFLDESRPAWQAKLMLREMAEPTEACEKLVEAYIRPMASVLHDILIELLPPETTERQRWMIGFSIVGQCLFYKVHRPVVELLYGKERYDELDLDRLSTHISAFSLAAVGQAPAVVPPLLPTGTAS